MDFPKHANANDAKVVAFILAQAIVKHDWTVSVYDGEEWVIKQSIDCDKISAAMMSTDNDTLRFRDLITKKVMGSIWLVYGNDGECFADASVDKGVFDTFTDDVMRKVNEVIGLG